MSPNKKRIIKRQIEKDGPMDRSRLPTLWDVIASVPGSTYEHTDGSDPCWVTAPGYNIGPFAADGTAAEAKIYVKNDETGAQVACRSLAAVCAATRAG